MKKFTGIRKRWMLNSIGVTAFIVAFAVVMFTSILASYYYSSMADGLKNKIRAATDFFITYYTTESAYKASASNYTNNEYSDREKLELQFLDANGTVFESSYAYKLVAGATPGTPDVERAMQNEDISSWSGRDPETGERIMAVSSPLIYNGSVKGVMRYVTSLRAVDRQIAFMAGLAVFIGLLLLGMVYLSNLFFVRSIVEPMASITRTAKRIAAGSYGVQIEKKYDDEIGELADTINDMSLKISQSEKMKSEFISSVSHELRTPLTAINGWGETLLSGEVSDPQDVRKGMGIIVSEAKRLTKMVEELLEFSRIEDGRFTLRMEPVDIKAELEDAVYTYREFFRKEGILLDYYDCVEEFEPVSADPERLRQVFSNLLDNAAKHGGAGKRITAAIGGEPDYIVIQIRDFGPGIPEEELPHVKAKFYKGSSKARGSGIGLAVCDEIVTRHGGRLDIANAEGGGCLVTIRLPRGGSQAGDRA